MSAPLSTRFNDEGLRIAEHPGIIFKDGPTGRRAASAIEAAAEALCLPAARVQAALAFYSNHREEIEEEVADALDASRTAEAAWPSRLRLLA
jgi:hypothetical protein